jgi:hypothetical protein
VGVRVKGWVVRECWAVTPTSARGHTECVRLLHTYTVSPRELLPTDMTHSGTTARSAVGVETFNKTVSYTTEWASHSCDGHRERECVRSPNVVRLTLPPRFARTTTHNVFTRCHTVHYSHRPPAHGTHAHSKRRYTRREGDGKEQRA